MMDLTGRKCIAIAYAWKFAATLVKDFHILLTVSKVSGVLESETPEAMWKHWSTVDSRSTVSYRIQFPPAINRRDEFGVSGVAGLLGPERTRSSSESGAAFERAVSDALMWELVSENLQSETGEYPIVLIQGPLIPKLRGRLYYRMLDSALPLLFVTFQPEWLNQVPRSLRPPADRSGSGSQAAEVEWLGPVPALSIDEPGRYFLGFMNGDLSYQVELPANTLDPKHGKKHWSAIGETCAAIFSGKWQPSRDAGGLSSDPRLASLPAPLACAILQSLERLEWEYKAELAFVVWQALGRNQEVFALEGKAKSAAPESRGRQRMTPAKWVQQVDQLFLSEYVGTSGPRALERESTKREEFLRALSNADRTTVDKVLQSIPNVA